MQEQLLHAAEPGRRPAQQYAGVDLRRPKGYVAAAPPSSPKAAAKATSASAAEGEACPRCESRDTKFCYYNNYNTSQPRHFCKGCRRYWTKGGTLRSVPVGGGTRKRPASSSSSVKKPSKKRRAPTPPEPATDDDDVVTAPGNATDAKVTETTTTPPTDASASATASEITTELVVPAAAAVAEGEDSFTDLLHHGGDDAVALDLAFSDYPVGGGKALGLGEPYSFEWPPSFDLGAACWGGAGFTDPDPGVFMNLP